MSNEITLGDRASTVIRETIYPTMTKNFYRLSRKPWLRYLGMNFEENYGKGPSAMGNDDMRVRKVETMGVKNNQFKVIHNTTAFGGGVQAADEREALVNGNYAAQRSTATIRTIQGQFTISQQAMDALAEGGNEDAFVDEVVQNTKGATHRVHKDMNRMFMGDIEGILCYVDGATSASTTVTVKTNPSGTALNEKRAVRHLHKGDVLYIGTRAQIVAGSGYSTVTVSDVTAATTFTATAAQTLADNALVVRQGVYSSTNSYFKEMTGMAAMVAVSGTVQGLNKASYEWFQSYSASVGGALAVSDLTNMLNTCREFADVPSDLILVGNQKQWARYESKIATTKQINYNDFKGKLAGGIEGLAVYSADGQIPFYIDNDVTDGVIYCLDPNGYMLGYTQMLKFLPAVRSTSALEWINAFYMTAEHAQLNAQSSGKLTGITS